MPSPLQDSLVLITDPKDLQPHNLNTRSQDDIPLVLNGPLINLPKVRTEYYGMGSIFYKSSAYWNQISNNYQLKEKETPLHQLYKKTCKDKITDYIISTYECEPVTPM